MNTQLIVSFLRKVQKNNNREWFEKNKELYKSVLDEFTKMVNYFLTELGKVDEELSVLAAKHCIYRIYRDIRFSRDKTPYKTHMGAFFAPGGRKSGNAGYYIHLQPNGESLLGGGLYRPETQHLAKVRQEIDYNAIELKKIVTERNFRKVFGEVQGEKLARAPKGFAIDHPNIELLKLKDYLVLHKFSDKEVLDPSFHRQVVRMFKGMKPFNDYLNVAIS